MQIKVFTTLPSFYDVLSRMSILARAMQKGIWTFEAIDISTYGLGGYKRVDDYPYGGGSGMILRPDVLGECIEKHIDFSTLTQNEKSTSKFICTSPRGVTFNQKMAEHMANNIDNLYILSNRFEGIDQRVIDYYNIEEVSIGDYIVTGGEVPSLVIMESIVRLLEGALGNEAGLEEESFSQSLDGMLEYDQFTKPAMWKNIQVPEVLLSGNHKNIRQWRKESSIHRTNKAKGILQNKNEC